MPLSLNRSCRIAVHIFEGIKTVTELTATTNLKLKNGSCFPIIPEHLAQKQSKAFPAHS